MKPLLRTLGVAVLSAALLNASAGLCFCHRGPALPGAPASAHGCCHGPDASGTTVVKAISTCCQIESAESSATPAAAIQLAPPAAVVTPLVGAPATGATVPVITTVLIGASPPLSVLRL
jgi:hypothetical protein